MATAKARADLGLAPGEPGTIYGKRDNIAVPGADAADPALTTIETAAAARETDREKSGPANAGHFTPDAADYEARGSERG